MTLISGIRWYRDFPTQRTELVVASGTALWASGDPISTYPYAPLSEVMTFLSQNANEPVSFAPVRDPAANNGSGSDILVICGFTGNYGFSSGSVTVTSFAAGDTFAVTLVNGGTTVTTTNYTALTSDSATTIAQNLVALINASAAVTPGSPFIGQSYNVSGTVYAGALSSGVAGNSITIQLIHNGAGGSVVSFTGGGAATSAPLKFDGFNVSGLSYQITRPFTGCVTWHNHVWYWGDPSTPDTLYASDIDQPEGWTFMTENGGYDIGVGDGDPSIRAVVPIGNMLYVFKSNSIYSITGYDFQSGEYQFNVQPAIRGQGTPTKQCVAVLDNAIVFWNGRRFCRLAVGSLEVEHIGATIPITEGLIANGSASVIRAVAGSFSVESNLNEAYSNSTIPISTGVEMVDSIALFAVDIGDGSPDTILVYDDAASRFLGNYAWSKWTGWNVGAWIPFGQGPSFSGQLTETPLLCWVDAGSSQNPNVFAYGTDPMSDSGTSIPWFAQTGWVTLDTGALQKLLHKIYLEIEATSGAQFSFTITPSVTVAQSGQPTSYAPVSGAFAAAGGAVDAETYQILVASIEPALRANAYLFGFGENSGNANYELIKLTLDYIEESFKS